MSIMENNPTNPFDIPELRDSLGLYLGKRQLFTCTLACKSWNHSFSPLLYRRIDILAASSNPSFETLVKYSDYIVILYLSGLPGREYYSLPCSYLLSLEVSDDNRGIPLPKDKRQDFVDLLLRNKSTLITFCMYTCYDISSPRLWAALAQCDKIESFSFYSVIVKFFEDPAFWMACSNASILILCNHTFLSYPGELLPDNMPDQFPRLKNLRLIRGLPVNEYVKLIQRCPSLVTLFCNSQDLELSNDQCEALRTSKSMKSLRDWHASGSSVSDEFIAAKLAASTQLDSIVLNGSKFSENSFRSLVENHAKTIRKISLGACTTITSIQIQGILSHCFLLEEFDAYKINCIDLAKIDLSNKAFDPNNPTTYENIILGEDWVCVGLRNLELFFNMSVDDFGKELRSRKDRIIVQQQQHKLQERHAFRQLSRLTKLETLSFSTAAIWDSKNQKGLEMKLMSQGGELDQLESLRNIKSIDFTGTSQTMGIEDIDWMILHFPKLKFLRGSLHYDAFQDVELKAYFNKSSQLNS